MFATRSIKRKVILTVICLCFASITILVFFAYRYQMHQLREGLQGEAESEGSLFRSILAADAEGLARAHIGLDRLDTLLEPFAANNKDELLAAAQPIFNEMRSSNHITHMYFIDTGGKVLLRVHKPEEAGDVLNRITFLKAQATQRLASGLEIGENFFSLRSVAPVSFRGNPIGYLEVAEEIDHVFSQMKRITGYEESLFLTESYLNSHPTHVQGEKAPGNFRILYPTQKEQALGLAELLQSEMTDALREPKVSIVSYRRGNYVVAMGPVQDAAGATVGVLFSQKEISPLFSTIWAGITAYTAILIAILLSSLFLLYLSLRKSLALFRVLKEHILSVTTTWDLSKRVKIDTHDEIGELADDFNAMAEKLRVLNLELEQRVSERTADLRRLNRLYAVLSGTDEAIVRAADRDSLFQEICRIAVEQGGFLMAWIGVVDEETETISPVTWSGVNDGYLDNIRISTREIPEGSGPTGTAFREGRLVVMQDLINDPLFAPWREEALKRGYRSDVAIPLKVDGRPVGVLTIYSGETNFFDTQFGDLLLQMAEDISFALNSYQHEALRKKAERALRVGMIERMQIMEALREKEKFVILQSRQAAMGEMVNNIAHQWRQPLNALNLTVQELLLCYDHGQFSRELLAENVARSMELVKHMSQTIEDFRGFFRPDSEMKPFNLAEVIRKTLVLISDSLKAHSIEVGVESEEGLTATGFANEYCQVLLNILNNARDALVERGVASPRIEIRCFSENTRSVTTVSDNAGGIPESLIDRVFEPYFTTKDEARGTGIGLYISKTIIEQRMKGRLSVRNSEKGAEFRIEL
jgi:C4-dicarboxylate-specific signal transduction histidine kinase